MWRIVVVAFAAASLTAAAPARAQSNEDRLRDQLRQTTLQMRALQDENSALKAREQTLRLQAEATAQVPRPAPATATATAPASAAPPSADAQQAARLERRLREAAAQKAALASELAGARAELARLHESVEGGALAARSRAEEAARQQQQTAAAEARAGAGDAALQRCSQMNEQLVGIGRELLERYRHKGVSEALMGAEPVIGIARVRLETLAQALQARIKDNSVPAGSP